MSSEDGFSGDLLGLVRDLNLPLVRYPGGFQRRVTQAITLSAGIKG